MRKLVSIMAVAATAMRVTPAIVAMAAASSSSSLETQRQRQQRLLEDGWYGASWGGSEHESDGGKSGKGSKSSSGEHDDVDGWNDAGPWWSHPPPPPHPPGWYTEHEGSSKSGKSKSSKVGDHDSGHWEFAPGWSAATDDGWSAPYHDEEESSGKSGKGSSWGGSGKSGKGEEEDGSWEDGGSWYGPWGPPPPPPEFIGKSKSSKGSSNYEEEGWFRPWGPPPGWHSEEPEGKSGKAKSSKSENDDGEWVLLPPPSGWDDDGWSGADNDSGSGKSGKSGSGSSGSGKSGKSSYNEPDTTPTWSSPSPPKEEEEEEHHITSEAHAICFEKGARFECSSWGNDGHGGDSVKDDAMLSVPFTYTVETNGKVDPESTIPSMEHAILEDVAAHVEGNDKYASFSGKISTAPGSGIADDDWCGDGHAVRCSVVKGEMSVSPAWGGDGQAWSGDGHAAGAFGACSACGIVKDSMEGQDYADIDGVTGAKYRNCDAKCDSGTVIAGAATVVPPQDDDLSGGALFAIWLAALAAIALLALLLARKRRKPQEVNEDMSLISNDLDGNHFSDYEDPYANTIDVHKCTSIYCNCNSNSNETTFLPAPKTVDISRTMSENGLSPPSAVINQRSHEEASNLNQEPAQEDSANDFEYQTAINESRGSIMRMPLAYYQSEETSDRPLTPVNEIAHDSEIDTELESVADDETNIPPPPPIAFHPSYNKGQQSSDEISI